MDTNNNTRVYHGNIRAVDIARTLKGEFHRGNYVVQTYGKPDKIVLQIATRQHIRSGGQTALTVHLDDTDDGVMVGIQKQKKTYLKSLSFQILVILKLCSETGS